MVYYETCNPESELYHWGIKGMKWGVRRYQNADGTLTEAGKQRYGTAENFDAHRQAKKEKNAKAKKIATRVALGVTVAGLAGAGIYAYRKGLLPSQVKLKHVKDLKHMSSDALKSKLSRLQMEKQVLDLERDIRNASKGEGRKVLDTATKATAISVATAGGLYGAKRVIRRVANNTGHDGDKLIREMFPKKK